MPLTVEQNTALRRQVKNLLPIRFPPGGIAARQRAPGPPVTENVSTTPPPSTTKPPPAPPPTTLPPPPGGTAPPPAPPPAPMIVSPPTVPLSMQDIVRVTHIFSARQTIGASNVEAVVWGPLDFPWRIRHLSLVATTLSDVTFRVFIYALTGGFANFPSVTQGSAINVFPVVPAGWTLIEPVLGQFTSNLTSPDRRVTGLIVGFDAGPTEAQFDMVTQIYQPGTGFAFAIANDSGGAQRARLSFSVEEVWDIPSDQAFTPPFVSLPVPPPQPIIVPPEPAPGPGPTQESTYQASVPAQGIVGSMGSFAAAQAYLNSLDGFLLQDSLGIITRFPDRVVVFTQFLRGGQVQVFGILPPQPPTTGG